MPVLLAPEATQKELSISPAPPLSRDARSRGFMVGLGIAVFCIGFPWLMVRLQAPPNARLSTQPGEFSAIRAQENLGNIAHQPRPVGSQAHEVIRTAVI